VPASLPAEHAGTAVRITAPPVPWIARGKGASAPCPHAKEVSYIFIRRERDALDPVLCQPLHANRRHLNPFSHPVPAVIHHALIAAANEKEVLDLGGVQALLAVARRHAARAGVVDGVCGALRNVTCRNGGCTALWVLLRHTRRRCPGNPHQCSPSLPTLPLLRRRAHGECLPLPVLRFRSSADARGLVARLGGVKALLDCVHKHRESPRVVTAAFGALRNLALTRAWRAGGCEGCGVGVGVGFGLGWGWVGVGLGWACGRVGGSVKGGGRRVAPWKGPSGDLGRLRSGEVR
jgi:hypothetical protein